MFGVSKKSQLPPKEYFARMGNWASQEKYRKEIDEVIKLLQLRSEDKVLDVGCCSGIGSFYIAQKVGCDILGVDAVEEFVKNCKIKAVLGDMQALPFQDNSFDALIMFHVIGHVLDPRKALKEAKRVLKLRGRMVIATPNRNFVWAMKPLNYLGVVKHDPDSSVRRYYTKRQLIEDVAVSGLTIKSAIQYGKLPNLAKPLGSSFLASPFRERIIVLAEKV